MENFKHYIIPIALLVLIISIRVKRSIGFQKYAATRLTIRIVLFALIATLILGMAVLHPSLLMYDVVGIILGLTLAFLAVKNTVFENRNEGLFYRTHIWLELSILFLFFARLLYRLYSVYGSLEDLHSQLPEQNQLQYIKDPFTGFVLLLLCTYYIGYFAYILKMAKQK